MDNAAAAVQRRASSEEKKARHEAGQVTAWQPLRQ
jgi:hypothetical protein